MKKFLILLSGIIIVCTLLISFKKEDKIDLSYANIAEVRYNLFSAEDNNLIVTFMSGKREEPYVLDGVPQKEVEFGIVTIVFKIEKPNVEDVTAVLNINDKQYTSNLEENPFDGTYVYDIKTVVKDDDNLTINITWGDNNKAYNLQIQSQNWSCDWKKALKIASNEFKTEIENFTVNGKLEAEIYVKIIEDPSKNLDKKYWYVGLLSKTGKKIALIIDPETDEILARQS